MSHLKARKCSCTGSDGFVSPILVDSLAGYQSARLYKMFRGTDFKKNTFATACLFPGVAFAIFLVLDIAVAVEGP